MVTGPSPSLPSRRPAKSSQRISLRPTMFRTNCDKRVTTSAARQPTHSKPEHPEMPTGKPDMHHTRPRQSCALPHHRTPAAHRNPSDSPSVSTHPRGTRHVIPLRHCDSRIAALSISPASAAWPSSTLTKHPHASRRGRPTPSHCRGRWPPPAGLAKHRLNVRSARNLQPHPNDVVSTFKPFYRQDQCCSPVAAMGTVASFSSYTDPCSPTETSQLWPPLH